MTDNFKPGSKAIDSLEPISSTEARQILASFKLITEFTGATSHYYFGVDSAGNKITVIHDNQPDAWLCVSSRHPGQIKT